jgi:CheY-like chemotaxis protein/anti-anti-sigma regulatory factor
MAFHRFLDVETVDDPNVIRLTCEELDAEAAESICGELSRLAVRSKDHRLRLDLGHVGHLTAAALDRLVALHSELQTEGGGLTLFNVRLPVYEAMQTAHLTDVLEICRAVGKNILVVDDDDDLRDVLKWLLEREGYTVTCAADGREALELLRTGGRPALILLDLMMGGMDGWQFRQEQRHDPTIAAIPVVIISATADVPRSAAELGVAGYLQKPVALYHLLQAVQEHSDGVASAAAEVIADAPER